VGSLAVEDAPLLLDTVAFIYWHAGSTRLGKRARKAMMAALERPVYVSAVTALEISTKVRLGKLHVPAQLLSDFQYVVGADGFRLLDLDAKAAIDAGRFESNHRDPFDRLIAAQAVATGGVVVTNDEVFGSEFEIEVLW
jgi:PIN domain nuclease of toxin-antitoxin system